MVTASPANSQLQLPAIESAQWAAIGVTPEARGLWLTTDLVAHYLGSMLATSSVVGFADHITTVLDIDELRSMSEALFATGLMQGWPLSEQPGFATASP